jgi:hypothetical protein
MNNNTHAWNTAGRLTVQEEINADFDAAVASIVRDVRSESRRLGCSPPVAFLSYMELLSRCSPTSAGVLQSAKIALGLVAPSSRPECRKLSADEIALRKAVAFRF